MVMTSNRVFIAALSGGCVPPHLSTPAAGWEITPWKPCFTTGGHGRARGGGVRTPHLCNVQLRCHLDIYVICSWSLFPPRTILSSYAAYMGPLIDLKMCVELSCAFVWTILRRVTLKIVRGFYRVFWTKKQRWIWNEKDEGYKWKYR